MDGEDYYFCDALKKKSDTRSFFSAPTFFAAFPRRFERNRLNMKETLWTRCLK